MDDVLADFVQGFTSAVLATGVRKLSPDHPYTEWGLSKSLNLSEEEDDKVYSLINMPGFATMLSPLPEAVVGLKKVMKIADVIFVTSPLDSSPTWVYDRRLWLEKQFGKEQGEKVVNTGEKYAVDGDFLLDDKPAHCSAWSKEHPAGMALLWATDRNNGPDAVGLTRVNNWDLVYELVKLRAQWMKTIA